MTSNGVPVFAHNVETRAESIPPETPTTKPLTLGFFVLYSFSHFVMCSITSVVFITVGRICSVQYDGSRTERILSEDLAKKKIAITRRRFYVFNNHFSVFQTGKLVLRKRIILKASLEIEFPFSSI